MTDSTCKSPIFSVLIPAAMLCMPAVGVAATQVRLAVTPDAMTPAPAGRLVTTRAPTPQQGFSSAAVSNASGLLLSSSSLTLMLCFVGRRRGGGLPLVLLLLPTGVVSLTLLAACDSAPMP